LHSVSIAELRAGTAAMQAMGGEPELVKKVQNFAIPRVGGEIPVRLYTPEGDEPLPVLVFFHGGGWVLGNLDTHDVICRSLANQAGCIVLAVDYRLAPEHKFPAAVEDAFAATKWAAENASKFGGDPTRIAVGGDSAGGNLSAVVSQMARDTGAPDLVFQLLIYPAVAKLDGFPSYFENSENHFMTRESAVWFYEQYIAQNTNLSDPKLFPLYAESLANLPPALVITAEYDVLCDEGEAYAHKLEASGVAVTLTRYDGMIHPFYSLGGVLPQAKVAIAQSANALKQAFAR
jgi:acetyl esterase